MARMFPTDSPQETGSRTAEPIVYRRLKEQLSDEFVVIHSLPWLASAAKEIDGRSVPTGEIDFLVLHEKLGILAIEVKGGIFTYNRTEFVYKRTGQRIDPVRQVRRGVHALAKLLHESGAGSWRIGYCLIFPESEMQEAIPISLIDLTIQPPQPIVFDISHLNNLGTHIQEVMTYWKKSLSTWQITKKQFEKLIDVLLPSPDYTPCWQTRINNDIVTWLQLTAEQTGCLNKITQENRLVVTGFPGTGKTLLLIEHVRRLSKSGKKVLVLTYNSLLAKRIRDELSDIRTEVYTFHEQCRQAARITGNSSPMPSNLSDTKDDREWYSTTAPILLQQALDNKKLPNYDSLVIDEGQVFHINWWQILTQWFEGKQITAFCDSTQIFNFESSTATLPLDIAKAINAKSPYTLTINLRSPRTIFDRVTQVRSSEYQQSCPRPFEEDTLSENVVLDTNSKLDQIIDQLDKEKIPKESVVILTTSGSSQSKEYYAGIEIISASKFRGLESPVVIIWTGGRSDDTALFSAYTRATSRCIVIYNASQVISGTYGTFGQILLDLDRIGSIQKESDSGLTSVIFEKQKLNLISVANKTTNLFWCPDWHSWIISPGKFDRVSQLMWIYHLAVTTNHPIYSWDLYDRRTFKYFQSSQPLDNYFHENCSLWYCKSCEITTPFTIINRGIDECTICCRQENSFSLDASNPNFDLILEPDPQSSLSEKKKLSIFLIALGIWNTISDDHKRKFDSDFLVGGSIGYQVAYLLVLTDLLRKEDLVFELDEMAKRYILWCPDLEKRIDQKDWRKMVARGVNQWLQKNVLRKVKPGIYEKSEEFLETYRLK